MIEILFKDGCLSRMLKFRKHFIDYVSRSNDSNGIMKARSTESLFHKKELVEEAVKLVKLLLKILRIVLHLAYIVFILNGFVYIYAGFFIYIMNYGKIYNLRNIYSKHQ